MIEFFPTELYETIGVSESTGESLAAKKQLLFSSLDTLNPLDELMGSDDDEGGEKKPGEEGEGVPDGDDGEEPDEFTDDYEGDYNAEQYFEGGGDDEFSDYGDDGGEDYM